MTTIIIPQYETSRIRIPLLQNQHGEVVYPSENDTQEPIVNPLVVRLESLSDSSSSSDNGETDDSSSDDALSYSIIHSRFDERNQQQQLEEEEEDKDLATLQSQWSLSSMLRPKWFGSGIIFGLIIQLITLSSIISRYYNQQLHLQQQQQQQQLQSFQKDLNDNTETQTTISWIRFVLLSHLDLILYTIIWLAFTIFLVTTTLVQKSSSSPSACTTTTTTTTNIDDVVQQQQDHTNQNKEWNYNYNKRDDAAAIVVSFINFLIGLIVGSLLVWISYNILCQYVVAMMKSTNTNNYLKDEADMISMILSSTRISWLSIVQTISVDGTVFFVTILYATRRRDNLHPHHGCAANKEDNTTIMMIL